MSEPNAAPDRRMTSDVVRYLLIAIVGMIVDLIIALIIRRVFALPLPVATAIGFLSAVALNYVLLERFLFGRTALSWTRLAKTYASAQGALLVRVLVAWVLSRALHGSLQADAIVLITSASISFVANFLIVRLLLR